MRLVVGLVMEVMELPEAVITQTVVAQSVVSLDDGSCYHRSGIGLQHGGCDNSRCGVSDRSMVCWGGVCKRSVQISWGRCSGGNSQYSGENDLQ